MTSKELQRRALLPLVRLAAAHLDTLPPRERADVLEGISLTLRDFDFALSAEADTAARALRDAEAAQLNFFNLIHDTP